MIYLKLNKNTNHFNKGEIIEFEEYFYKIVDNKYICIKMDISEYFDLKEVYFVKTIDYDKYVYIHDVDVLTDDEYRILRIKILYNKSK